MLGQELEGSNLGLPSYSYPFFIHTVLHFNILSWELVNLKFESKSWWMSIFCLKVTWKYKLVDAFALTQFEHLPSTTWSVFCLKLSMKVTRLKGKASGCFSWKPAPVLSQAAPWSNPPLHNALYCNLLHNMLTCTALWSSPALHNTLHSGLYCTALQSTAQNADLMDPCRIH